MRQSDEGGGDQPARGSVPAAQRRLLRAAAVSDGADGLAAVLAELCGRPVAVWDDRGVLVAVAPTREADDDRDYFLPAEMPVEQPFRRGDWWYWSAQPDERVWATVGLLDPGGAAPDPACDVLCTQAVGMIALQLRSARILAHAELRAWGTLADALLTGRADDRVRAHAATLGYDIDRPHRVLCAELREADDHAGDEVVRVIHRFCPDAIVTRRSRQVVALLPYDMRWDPFEEAVESAVGRGNCRLATSSRADSVGALPQALREAEYSVRLGDVIDAPMVTHFDELGLYQLLGAGGDSAELDRFVERWLGKAIAYDRRRNSALVQTLKEYLERGCSIEQAAEALIIHRSTLRYRLSRFEELTGHDLGDPDMRFHLQLAVRILTTLKALRSGRDHGSDSGPPETE